MKINILDTIDFAKVDTLLEGFNKSTGFVTAILDLDGNIVSKSGWRQMCTEFHRINPETSKKCTISDTELANKMGEGEKYHFYKCLNGLVDVAMPVVINGEHVANLFSGQFFFEEPDIPFFKKQAKKYGFDENKYLDALSKVPIFSQEKVKNAMDFLLNMTQLISETTFQKLEQMELNKNIRESEVKAKESEEKFRKSIENFPIPITIAEKDGKLSFLNKQFIQVFGYTHQEIPSMEEWFTKAYPDNEYRNFVIHDWGQEVERSIKNDVPTGYKEYLITCKNGEIKTVTLSAYFEKGTAYEVFRDITDRKQAENALLAKMAELERFFKFTVGREITMVELKKEINNLLKKLGEDPKYKIVE